MTPTEALALQPGDRVRWRTMPDTRGTVAFTRFFVTAIDWDAGGWSVFLHDMMAGLVRCPAGPLFTLVERSE